MLYYIVLKCFYELCLFRVKERIVRPTKTCSLHYTVFWNNFKLFITQKLLLLWNIPRFNSPFLLLSITNLFTLMSAPYVTLVAKVLWHNRSFLWDHNKTWSEETDCEALDFILLFTTMYSDCFVQLLSVRLSWSCVPTWLILTCL